MSNDKLAATFGGLARGSDDDYCSAYPRDGHFWVDRSVDAAPVRWVKICSWCGRIHNGELRRQLAPDGTGFVEIAAQAGSITMDHVDDCCCRYVASPKDTTDVKLLDSRCIVAYRVPLAVVGAAEPSDAPSGEDSDAQHPERPRETVITLQEFDD